MLTNEYARAIRAFMCLIAGFIWVTAMARIERSAPDGSRVAWIATGPDGARIYIHAAAHSHSESSKVNDKIYSALKRASVYLNERDTLDDSQFHSDAERRVAREYSIAPPIYDERVADKFRRLTLAGLITESEATEILKEPSLVAAQTIFSKIVAARALRREIPLEFAKATPGDEYLLRRAAISYGIASRGLDGGWQTALRFYANACENAKNNSEMVLSSLEIAETDEYIQKYVLAARVSLKNNHWKFYEKNTIKAADKFAFIRLSWQCHVLRRNEIWIQTIAAELTKAKSPATIFLSVGAMHLIDFRGQPNSLLSLLKQRGFKIERFPV